MGALNIRLEAEDAINVMQECLKQLCGYTKRKLLSGKCSIITTSHDFFFWTIHVNLTALTDFWGAPPWVIRNSSISQYNSIVTYEETHCLICLTINLHLRRGTPSLLRKWASRICLTCKICRFFYLGSYACEIRLISLIRYAPQVNRCISDHFMCIGDINASVRSFQLTIFLRFSSINLRNNLP